MAQFSSFNGIFDLYYKKKKMKKKRKRKIWLCSTQQFFNYVGVKPVLSKDKCVLPKDTT